MKLTIHPTTQLCEVDGRLCRVWEGESDKGRRVSLFVYTIAVEDFGDGDDFGRELVEVAVAPVVTFPSHLRRGEA